ncbi:lamina-associated polypeptide 2-like [Paramuricea clavata]|uniref:Lamina-associated polypeptide 2-like n=1 Tax=Paramuricea clavata TaxID=317549 RepID=A0A6S7ITB1_PARCT|nr:lamina-associated polypeptide 2-like [Paramuricea clavata]
MSKAFNDPSLLTKDRLKKELESRGVKLPRGDQKKEFYVRLYRETVSRETISVNGEFSSDDDTEFDQSPQNKQIVPRGSRSIRKAASKDIVSVEIKSLTDEELKRELSALGSPVGPIMSSTRGLYERKLARMRESVQNNGMTTITKSEFSDDNFDEEEVHDEESAPDDEFFYKRQERNRRSGGDFGQTFTKNFQDTSSKKEVSRDFSVSSSRNVERSSSFDRKTMNKVRTKKGDKFEEQNWSSSSNNENADDAEDGADVLQLPGLPSSFQQALTAARFSPEKSPPATEMRARASRQQESESVPENIPETKVAEEKPKMPKPKTSRTWRWVLFIIIVILIIFAGAVVYNVEKLPVLNKQLASPGPPANPNDTTQ